MTTKAPLWRLINSWDPITFRAADTQVAFYINARLTNGITGSDPIDHKAQAVPLCILGDDDIIAFAKANWDMGWEEFEMFMLMTRSDEIVAALNSFLIGEDVDRGLVDELLDLRRLEGVDLATYYAQWNEDRRASMINCCEHARLLAQAITDLKEPESGAYLKWLADHPND